MEGEAVHLLLLVHFLVRNRSAVAWLVGSLVLGHLGHLVLLVGELDHHGSVEVDMACFRDGMAGFLGESMAGSGLLEECILLP